MTVTKRRLSSTSAKVAAAVDDDSIVNTFVTVLFTGGLVGVWIVFCRLVNLPDLSQAD